MADSQEYNRRLDERFQSEPEDEEYCEDCGELKADCECPETEDEEDEEFKDEDEVL